MPESTSLLHDYLRTVVQLHPLEAVTVFLPREPQRPLVHVGEGLAPPELATVPLASELAARTEPGVPAEVLASQDADCRVVRLSAPGARRERRRGQGTVPPPSLLLGLRLPAGEAVASELPIGRIDGLPRGWRLLFEQIEVLALATQRLSQIVNDPVTGLPGRVAFQSELEQAFEKASAEGTALSLLLLSTRRFEQVNERFGRPAGDRLMQRIAGRFASSLRSDDPAAKYGGAILAALLPGTDAAGAGAVARKVSALVGGDPYEEVGGTLEVHVGTVTHDPRQNDGVVVLDLMRRAERALAAAKVQKAPIVAWEPGLEDTQRDALKRLDGFFTGDMSRDYRSMRLLAESVSLVATCADSEALTRSTVELLVDTLPLERAALVDWTGDEQTILAWARRGRGAVEPTSDLRLSPTALQILFESRSTGEVTAADLENGRSREYAIPLLVGSRSVGGLFLEADSELLDATDLSLLRPLTSQLAVALDRVRLEETERRMKQLEVERLRKTVQQTQLLFRSTQMTNLVGLIRRVAPTDATVLVTGESGTGKELVSRTLHQLSRRAEKPLVIVDCAAIPPTLIESELFGHERGAYTGAQTRRIGHLEEADGGSVFLDEIGELPLEVQSKLLRFVQEKQLSRIGSTRSKSVDVRVIAATNRDLAAEVEAGRFREDLYYRLNVVRLEVPALRERREDIQYLAESFLETYNQLYDKRLTLSHEAVQRINGYQWPGNVRELQNKLQQAVILSEGHEIRAETLGLAQHSRQASVETEAPQAAEETSADASEALAHLLDGMVGQIARGERPVAPLGRWLSEDLILEADRAAEGVATRAARLLGMADTTYRRQRERVTEQTAAGMVTRTDGWSAVAAVLERLVEEPPTAPLPEHVQNILLSAIATHLADAPREGAAVLGVSMPTYRQRMASHAAEF